MISANPTNSETNASNEAQGEPQHQHDLWMPSACRRLPDQAEAERQQIAQHETSQQFTQYGRLTQPFSHQAADFWPKSPRW
jgi:hypothetical protein